MVNKKDEEIKDLKLELSKLLILRKDNEILAMRVS